MTGGRVDLLVAGAGPAGCAAAVQARRLGWTVALADPEAEAGGLVRNARLVENLPDRAPIRGPALAARLAASIARRGLAVIPLGVARIVADPDDLDAGPGLPRAARVVVATGTTPRRLDVPGAPAAEAAGWLVHEARLLRIPRAGRVLVVGGGESALDGALGLARRGVRVDLLLRGDAPRARGDWVDAALAHRRVRVHRRLAVVACEPGRLTVEGPEGARALAADACLVCVGRLPAPPPVIGDPANRVVLAGDVRRGALGHVAGAIADGLDAVASLASS